MRSSASAKLVSNTSSVSFLPSSNAFRASLTDLTSLSQAPPMCGADGGLKFQLVLASVNSSLHSASTRTISLLAPWKFVPLSLKNSMGIPLRQANRLIAMTHDCVVKLCTTSRWMARVVKHVKRLTQRFSERRPTVTATGPK
uniref:(northern house mosquito) hypothetical protein n=1 Tax=Culex pipiens TaxID=7175 RepID=A0A8D8AVF4_CULPI